MRYTVNASILLTQLPVLDRPAAAKAAGFEGVEFWWPFDAAVPDRSDVDAFVEAIRSAGVRLTGLNLFAGDMDAGDRGLVSWVGREDEFRANLEVVVEIGERLGTRMFNALYGNRLEGVDDDAQDALARRNLATAAAAIESIGGIVLVEPLSGVPDYPVKTAADALRVIEGVRSESGAENVKLLADFYHLAVNGDDVAAVIRAHAPEIGHVQIADAPGRGAPGTGELPLAEWVGAARAAGFAGPVSLEYRAPEGDPFAWMPSNRDGDR